MTKYMCCRHCEPGCPSFNDHDLTCILGCLPYAINQEEDKEMTQPLSSEPPWYAEKTPATENIPAEALEETLEFERAQWQTERENLISNLADMSDMIQKLDNFILDSVVTMGQSLRAVQDEVLDGEEAIKSIIGNFINEMPTPEKVEMEQHIAEDHWALGQASKNEETLRGFLNDHGYDADAIIEEASKRDHDFLRTLLEGFGQMSADFNDEAPLTDDQIESDEDPDA